MSETSSEGEIHSLYTRIAELEQKITLLELDAQSSQPNEVFVQRILETSPQIIYVYDFEQQQNIFSNRRIQEVLGYSAQQIIEMGGSFFSELLHPDDIVRLPMLLKRWEQATDQDILTVEYQMQHADGSWRWFLATNGVFQRNAEGRVSQIIGSALDITERKKIDAEREGLLLAIEHTDDMVVITDAKGLIQYVNSAFERVSGYSRDEVLGKNMRILKSGQMDEQVYAELWNTLKSGKSWEGRFLNKRKDGALFTEQASISPVRNSAHEIVNFVAVKHDITQDLILEQQYLQTHKMESIGRLAGGIAHDFNNMLTLILGHIELALCSVEGPESLINDLQEVKLAAQTSAELTQQLLAFARKQPMEPKLIDLNHLITHILSLLQRLVGEKIKLCWNPGSELGLIQIDPGQVNQILTNLVINARDAFTDQGTITLETCNVFLRPDDCLLSPGLHPGAYILLGIYDNGPGMDADVLEHLFEPFFTTKEMGLGTGLGLATVYGIVQQNKGSIQVDSIKNQGSRFEVYLPRVTV